MTSPQSDTGEALRRHGDSQTPGRREDIQLLTGNGRFTAYHAVPCTTNPIGVKGAGESGTIGAIPAVANAIMDALRTAGVERFEMPASPNRIWHALQSAPGANNYSPRQSKIVI